MIKSNQPLATRFRPRSIVEIIGQDHLTSEGKVLDRIVKSKALTSIILYGPPGVGKTSIANALSKDLGMRFEYFNASIHSKTELEKATKFGTTMIPSIVMIDEVHRLTKPNQDYLLMKMEEGSIKIIGATTENPYMSINPALRSRSQIFELKSVSSKDIELQMMKALNDKTIGLGEYNVTCEEDTVERIAQLSNGDMRYALNVLELIVLSTEPNENGQRILTHDAVSTCIQSQRIDGDKNGDAHYNLLSAFQKSIRGSDVNASLHYLARLIKTGDLISINRRLLVIAYEDIGLANHELVGETLSAIESTEKVGFPEAKIILSYIVTRLALSPKSNASYKAIKLAEKALESNRNTNIPLSLHDTHYRGSDKLRKGEGYKYSHDYPYGIVKQQFMPDEFINDDYLHFRDESDSPNVQSIHKKIKSILKD